MNWIFHAADTAAPWMQWLTWNPKQPWKKNGRIVHLLISHNCPDVPFPTGLESIILSNQITIFMSSFGDFGIFFAKVLNKLSSLRCIIFLLFLLFYMLQTPLHTNLFLCKKHKNSNITLTQKYSIHLWLPLWNSMCFCIVLHRKSLKNTCFSSYIEMTGFYINLFVWIFLNICLYPP